MLVQTEYGYMALRVSPENSAVTTIQTLHQLVLGIRIVMHHTTREKKKKQERFDTGLERVTLGRIKHRFGQRKGRDDHHVVRIEVVGGRKTH